MPRDAAQATAPQRTREEILKSILADAAAYWKTKQQRIVRKVVMALIAVFLCVLAICAVATGAARQGLQAMVMFPPVTFGLLRNATSISVRSLFYKGTTYNSTWWFLRESIATVDASESRNQADNENARPKFGPQPDPNLGGVSRAKMQND